MIKQIVCLMHPRVSHATLNPIVVLCVFLKFVLTVLGIDAFELFDESLKNKKRFT
jgi:hypothetical protein